MWAVFAILPLLASNLRLVESACCDSALGCFPDSGDFEKFSTPYCVDDIDPKFGFYSRAHRDEASFITRDSAIPDDFSADKKTIFLVHGWQNDFTTPFLHTVKNALLDKDDVNVIITGWGGGASSVIYSWSAATTRVMGAEVALRMDKLKTEAGVDDSNIWCVGHSLGAHICGMAGNRTNIGRITGLDPARQEFEDATDLARLSSADAAFVDIIHTDAWGETYFHYGIYAPVGDADYYPNGGYDQPDCWTKRHLEQDMDEAALNDERGVSCSHTRAHELFLASITDDCFTVTQRCEKYDDLPGSCSECTDCGKMGYSADPSQKGIFYLKTKSEAPFCL